MTRSTSWLRLEAVAVLAAAVAAFAAADASWTLFLLLLLAPDLAMAGYLAGPRFGAAAYNLAHLYAWPAVLLLSWAAGAHAALAPALIWTAHIAMDRTLGYGLKEADAFRHTHLGWIGGSGRAGPTSRSGAVSVPGGAADPRHEQK